MRVAVVLCWLAAIGPLAAVSWSADPKRIEADVLLEGGTIIDGSGKRGRKGDVALKDDRIVAVGRFKTSRVTHRIDCRGLVVVPGFIDLHNHSDRQVVNRRTRANVNFLMQGCTTVVTGNCGAGPVDVADYHARIDVAGAGTNVAHLLPHGALRTAVMGSGQREISAEDLEGMKKLTEQAMRDGAWGMSTGLIYVPGTYADTDELVALCRVVAAHGGIYASHIRNESVSLLAAVEEALTIGKQAGLPVHISHFKSSGRESWGLVRRAAEMIQKARDAGQKATADQYPYIASSTSLDAIVIPTWARAGGRKELKKRLDDPEQGKRIRDLIAANLARRDGGAVLKIARYGPRPEFVGRSVAEVAKDEKISAVELTVRIAQGGGASIVNFSMSEDDVRHVMQIPWVATASDGRAYLPGADRPHPRSYGTFPRKLGHYAIREKVLSLEQAVRSASGLPADILSMKDRGYLKPGFAADVTVFDPGELKDVATFTSPHRYSVGVRYVFVNGRPAVFAGSPTGALSGRVLKPSDSKSDP